MARIKGSAGEEQTISGIIVIRKLKSRDLVIYVNSYRTKKDMKETTE
jgi:hypothetical protein